MGKNELLKEKLTNISELLNTLGREMAELAELSDLFCTDSSESNTEECELEEGWSRDDF